METTAAGTTAKTAARTTDEVTEIASFSLTEPDWQIEATLYKLNNHREMD